MKGKPAEIGVRHNAVENRFEAEVEGSLSVADYRLEDGRMILTHTFVPPEMRDRGIAERMVRAALEYAQAEKLRVVPACSYVSVFVQRNPEFAPLIVEANGKA